MKETKIEDGRQIYSILSLNEKQFIVAEEKRINLFELEGEYTFHLVNNIKLDNYGIAKYPKNGFVFAENRFNENMMIHLYG